MSPGSISSPITQERNDYRFRIIFKTSNGGLASAPCMVSALYFSMGHWES